MEKDGSCSEPPQKNTRGVKFGESRKHTKKKTPKKFRWHDGTGRELTAGGILPYDEE